MRSCCINSVVVFQNSHLFAAVLSVFLIMSQVSDARRVMTGLDTTNYLRSAREAGHSTMNRAMGCSNGLPVSARMFTFLNGICEDCFELYRDTDLYHMCRSDCFGSDYFRGCMDVLLVERDDRREAANLVSNIHRYLK